MDWQEIYKALTSNLLAPVPLFFALGIICKVVHGGIKIPKDFYYAIAILLLMSIGFTGGNKLAEELKANGIATVWMPILVSVGLAIFTAVFAFCVTRFVGRLSVADAAGIAAHYAATSAVTFAVADVYVNAQHKTPNGYVATLVPILDCFGIATALAIGTLFGSESRSAGEKPQAGASGITRLFTAMRDVITGQSVMLLGGSLIAGALSATFMEEKQLHHYSEFFSTKELIFRGALCIFLLEMGLVAGERLGDLRHAGLFLIGYGIIVPVIHACIAIALAKMAGMNLGGAAVFGSIVASSSYIGAPPAVRLTLPEANPALSITASLAITFPFNIAFGVPMYFAIAKWMYGET
jgi:hypothetical protein